MYIKNKISKVFFLLSLFSIHTYCEENWEEINRIIFSNKKLIIEAINKGKVQKRNTDSTITEFFKDENAITNKEELKRILIALVKISGNESKYFRTILNENIFQITLKILSEINNRDVRSNIYTYIYEKRNYDLIKKNSELVKNAILKGHFGGTQSSLLLLCNINENEKEKLKNKFNLYYNNGFPLYIRIRLGEKEAQDTLLQMYEKETDFEKLKKLIEQLELAGTKRCEMALVNSLGTKDQEQHSKPGYSYSIKFFIIQALGKLNPNVSLLNDNFKDYQLEMEQYTTRYEINKQLTKDFYQKVYEWVKNKYGKEIKELKETKFLYSYWLFRTK